AAIEIVGDLKSARAQRLVKLSNPDADRIGHLGSSRIDCAGYLTDALIQSTNDILPAFGQRLCQLRNARTQQCFKLGEALVQRARNFARPACHELIEGIRSEERRAGKE